MGTTPFRGMDPVDERSIGRRLILGSRGIRRDVISACDDIHSQSEGREVSKIDVINDFDALARIGRFWFPNVNRKMLVPILKAIDFDDRATNVRACLELIGSRLLEEANERIVDLQRIALGEARWGPRGRLSRIDGLRLRMIWPGRVDLRRLRNRAPLLGMRGKRSPCAKQQQRCDGRLQTLGKSLRPPAAHFHGRPFCLAVVAATVAVRGGFDKAGGVMEFVGSVIVKRLRPLPRRAEEKSKPQSTKSGSRQEGRSTHHDRQ